MPRKPDSSKLELSSRSCIVNICTNGQRIDTPGLFPSVVWTSGSDDCPSVLLRPRYAQDYRTTFDYHLMFTVIVNVC